MKTHTVLSELIPDAVFGNLCDSRLFFGTQYTFLEAIYHDCALILHKEWVSKGNVFKDRYNCYVVGHTDDIGKEIADIINSPIDETYNNIVKNSQILLEKHINVKWF